MPNLVLVGDRVVRVVARNDEVDFKEQDVAGLRRANVRLVDVELMGDLEYGQPNLVAVGRARVHVNQFFDGRPHLDERGADEPKGAQDEHDRVDVRGDGLEREPDEHLGDEISDEAADGE